MDAQQYYDDQTDYSAIPEPVQASAAGAWPPWAIWTSIAAFLGYVLFSNKFKNT